MEGAAAATDSIAAPAPGERQQAPSSEQCTPLAALPGLKSLSAHSRTHSQLQDLTDKEPASLASQVESIYVLAEQERLKGHHGSLLEDVLNMSSVLTDGVSAMVDDSFLRCFTSAKADPWNWNFYLFPAWLLGVAFRYGILFPFRVVLLLGSLLLFFAAFFSVDCLWPSGPRKRHIERQLVRFMCGMFVASWTGVIHFHGPRPIPTPNRVWVANHTSMIDYIILCSYSPFAVIMQLHPGWVGFLQTRVLNSLGCLWFNRTQVKDRAVVGQRMQQHVQSRDAMPLLIFPEGTCVNNEYCVMFKRGAFDLGATVCPVAIKYNKIFVEAFWNSKRQSFTQHLLRLMTSWAVVCDVYFLEPQTRRPGETADQFATRVQHAIAAKAKLRVVPWDGYLKYYNLGEKHPGLIEKRRRVFADLIRTYLRRPSAAAAAAAEMQGADEKGGNDESVALPPARDIATKKAS